MDARSRDPRLRGLFRRAFRKAAGFAPLLEAGLPLDVAGELGINEFNGRRRLQLTVKDIKRSESNDQD